jgi:hypothetical protein
MTTSPVGQLTGGSKLMFSLRARKDDIYNFVVVENSAETCAPRPAPWGEERVASPIEEAP